MYLRQKPVRIAVVGIRTRERTKSVPPDGYPLSGSNPLAISGHPQKSLEDVKMLAMSESVCQGDFLAKVLLKGLGSDVESRSSPPDEFEQNTMVSHWAKGRPMGTKRAGGRGEDGVIRAIVTRVQGPIAESEGVGDTFPAPRRRRPRRAPGAQ